MAVLDQKPAGLEGHTHVIGLTRTGKSFAIAGWVLEAVRSGYGVLMIDPHGELYDQLVDSLVYLSTKDPALISRVFLFDPSDARCPGLDPLRLLPGENKAERADNLTDAICNIGKVDPAVVVLLRRVLRNLFKVLIEKDEPMASALKLLTDIVNADKRGRLKLLEGVSDLYARMFFIDEMPKGERGNEWFRSTKNRLEPLLSNPRFEVLFNRSRPSVNPLSIIENGQVMLVKTSKGLFTEEASNLLSSFFVTTFQQAAIRRSNKDKVFWMVLDEFHGYTSRAISALLSETGKYNTKVLMAHQYLYQIEDQQLREAVLSQVTDRIVFQIGDHDADELVTAIFRPDTNEIKHFQWRFQQIANTILVTPDITFRPLDEVETELKYRLTDHGLKPREFYLKRRNHRPIKLKSNDFAPKRVVAHVRDEFLTLVAPPAIIPGKSHVVNDAPLRESSVTEPVGEVANVKLIPKVLMSKTMESRSNYIPLWAA